MFDVLDLLWSGNKEFIHLVYELQEDQKYFDVCLNDLNKKFEDYKYDDDVLKKIHISIDYYIRGALNPKVKLDRVKRYADFTNKGIERWRARL